MAERTYLADRLREARKAAGMTLAEAGATVGKSSKAISAYEASINEPSVETLIKLCRSYGVDISYFFMKLNDNDDEERHREESEIIDRYRSCSTYGKRMIRDYIGMVSREYPKSDDNREGAKAV